MLGGTAGHACHVVKMADIEYGDDSEDEEETERNSSRAAAGAYSGYSGEEEEEEEVGSSLATSELHTRGVVLLRMNPRNSIAIFTAPHRDDDDHDTSGHGDGEVAPVSNSLLEVQWSGIVMTTDSVRKLVSQSHAFFVELQECVRKGVEPETCVKYSRLYRVALYECTQGLTAESENEELYDEEERQQIKDQLEMYSLLNVLWHLCEILFIETLPVGCLVQQLLEWVRWHDRHTDVILNDVMGGAYPDHHHDYWSIVYRLTLQGRIDDVRQLLTYSTYCKDNKKVYESIDELLRKVPMIKSVIGHSRTELMGVWFVWNQECKRRRERQEFVGCPELNLLCGLLCGDKSCFAQPEVLKCCKMWYDLLVGRLLYTSPLILSTDYDLHYIAMDCFKQYCEYKGTESSYFDSFLMSALENKVIDVIKDVSSKLSNWWFVSHLTNLLHHRGSLVTSQLEYGSQLSEFLLIEYATALFIHPSLWEVAINYLSYCPTQGRHFMCSLVERVPITTSTKALKLIRLCQRYEMTEEAQSICRVLARRCYGDGRMGSALTWCIRGQDATFAAFLAEKYFDSYEDVGKFGDLSLLDYLGDAVLLSNRLAFLSKYRDFHREYTYGNYEAAGQLLVNLLTSGITLKKYWLTLLTDSLPLLQMNDKCIFSSANTYKLLNILQEIENTSSYSNPRQDIITSQDELSTSKISLLRLALLRNLQSSLLRRGQQ